MPYLLVLGVSLLVGGGVYLATVRSAQEVSAVGFGGEQPESAGSGVGPAGPGYAYLRVSTEGPSIRDRIQGLVGLVVLVGLGAALLALAVFQVGHLINQTVEAFLNP